MKKLNTGEIVLNIAVTGNIGSGKSTVAKELASRMGAEYYSFDAAQAAFNRRPFVLPRLKNRIYDVLDIDTGRNVYQAKSFDELKPIIMANLPQVIDVLVEFSYPYMLGIVLGWLDDQPSERPTRVIEVPLLHKIPELKDQFDTVICVTCPEEERLQRVMKRDGRTEDEVKFLMSRQLPEWKQIELSNYCITTDCERAETHNQLDKLLVHLKRDFGFQDLPIYGEFLP